VPELGVPDAGRLMHARARVEGHFAHALVVELDPALEHVHELELHFVVMALRQSFRAGHGADDVRDGAARGCLLDAEVAVLEERAQSARPRGVLDVAHRELERVIHPFLLSKRAATRKVRHIRLPSR
jgi:hypothetical protein